MRSDKGSGVAILQKDMYDRKILEIIKNTAKFKKPKETPTLTREEHLQVSMWKI